jgi:dipeptidyl aminopeptidase/acylaminoacyl peptidase
MSPEQVRGEQIDTRSDIFSFGALLYELLTYKKAFDAETQVESMNAILKEDPPELPATVPALLADLLRACLEKSKDQRFQSAKDLAIALRALNNRSAATIETLTPLKPARKNTLLWIAAAAAILLAALAGFRLSQSLNDELEPLRITPLTRGPSAKQNPAFSPDGRSIAYQQNFEGVTEIVVQTPGSTRPVVLARGDAIGSLQWTSDGARVCYIGSGDLWCVGSAGGTPQRVLERVGSALSIARGTGAAYFLRTEKGVPKVFVSDPLGSAPRALDHAALSGLSGQLPRMAASADGTRLAFSTGNGAFILSLSPEGPGLKWLDRGSAIFVAKWFPGGRDLAAAQLNPVATLGSSIISFDAQGQHRRLVLPDSGTIISLDLSPDGNRIAYSHGQPDWNLAEYSLTGKRLREHGPGWHGQWSPSGDRFAFQGGPPPAVVIRSGAGADTLLMNGPGTATFSPDGTRVAVSRRAPSATFVYPAEGGRPVQVHSGSNFLNCWSPDGESLWLNEKGSLIKVPSQGGPAVPVVEGTVMACASDGSVAYSTRDAINILAPDGKTSRKLIPNRGFNTVTSAFGDAGRALYVGRSSSRAIAVIDTRTGAIGADINVELAPADRITGISLHPDGKRMLLTTGNLRYNISIAEGFAQPETGWRSWFRHWRVPPPPKVEPVDE